MDRENQKDSVLGSTRNNFRSFVEFSFLATSLLQLFRLTGYRIFDIFFFGTQVRIVFLSAQRKRSR